jgi:multidrug efflux pump subunit AcrA (membrane-fusion protein)
MNRSLHVAATRGSAARLPHPAASLSRVGLALALVLCAFLGACGPSAPAGPPASGAAAPAAPPPPTVGVVKVALGEVGLVEELPGRIEASRVAQVRARAAGIVQQRMFREGADVKAGQVLFRIDPAPYEAALASAQATLARAQANLSQASALAVIAHWLRPTRYQSRTLPTQSPRKNRPKRRSWPARPQFKPPPSIWATPPLPRPSPDGSGEPW